METLLDQKRWRVIKNGDNTYSIIGKLGEITEYGDGDLDVWIHAPEQTEVAYRRSHRRAVAVEREGWKVKNHYDDGALFVRQFSDLDKACVYIKAKRKRQVSEKTLAHLKAIGYSKQSPAQGGPKLDLSPPNAGMPVPEVD